MLTLGETVLFTFGKEESEAIENRAPFAIDEYGQGTTVPATVVAVWSDDCANLRVHPDGPGNDLWYTSVQRKSLVGVDGSGAKVGPFFESIGEHDA